MYTRYTELRRLHATDEYRLALKLSESDCWRLLDVIPYHINAQQCSNNDTLDWQKLVDKYGRKYGHEHMELIQTAFRASGGTRLVSQILLDEWKTSGRKEERPTLGVLLQLLVGADCWVAADFLATELLNEPKPKRDDGPAGNIPFPFTKFCEEVEDYVNDSSFQPDSGELAYSVNGCNTMNNNCDDRTKFIFEKRIAMDMAIDNTSNDNDAANNVNDTHNVTTADLVNGVELDLEPTIPPTVNNTKTNTQHSQTQQVIATTSDTNLTFSTPYIPKLSALMNDTSKTATSAASTHFTFVTDDSSSINTPPTSPAIYSYDQAPIPNLSILAINSSTGAAASIENYDYNLSNNTNVGISEDNLPILSAFYENGSEGNAIRNDVITDNELIAAASNTSSSSSSISNDEQTSNNDNDPVNNVNVDDDDVDEEEEEVNVALLPNLSFFEQNSSNNDSSLTSVTGTSGENSFEIGSTLEEHEHEAATIDAINKPTNPVKTSMDLETNDFELPSSQENIPCLSALYQQ